MEQYSFNVENANSAIQVKNCLRGIIRGSIPVIICMGSDCCIGDSLGPLVGTMLESSVGNRAYIYGTLKSPITAIESNVIEREVKKLHPKSKVLIIDAAVGNAQDIGIIKVKTAGIKPGLGIDKNLASVGDYSIIGIVADKREKLVGLMSGNRLSSIYKMSSIIAKSVELFINSSEC